jgi:hypothetical protein
MAKKKPSKDFPLTPHSSGKWCKTIRGKVYYFGRIDEPDKALREYLAKRDYLLAGIDPPSETGHTVHEVLDRFLADRKEDIRLGELSQVTWDDYRYNCNLILQRYDPDVVVESMGPKHFSDLRLKLIEGVGATTAANRIRMAKIALRHIEQMSDFKINFGKSLKEPSARTKRKNKFEAGKKLHTSLEIRAAVEAANPDMKAMLLLGINCAFGNSDCARLVYGHLDLDKGWHDYHREKTFIARRAKLWPETVKALRCLNKERHAVFETKYGNPWNASSISHESFKLGIEFYRLRRTFRTVADETRETMAIHLIMGHAKSSTNMDHVYVQEVIDKRLEFVAEYVRAWYLS